MRKVAIWVCQKCLHLVKMVASEKKLKICEKCGAVGSMRKRNDPSRSP